MHLIEVDMTIWEKTDATTRRRENKTKSHQDDEHRTKTKKSRKLTKFIGKSHI